METIKRLIISTFMLLGLLACSEEEFQASKDLFSESFSQTVQKKKIDLIIVVDNSISMIRDQEKLSREFESFMTSIQDSDFRIGVITTDAKSDGKENTPGYYGNLDTIGANGELYISLDSTDPAELFRNAIHRKETQECIDNGQFSKCVTQYETPIKALRLALEKRNSTNSGFFRSDAEIGVVIITDEDETVDPDDGSIMTPVDFVTFFEEQFASSKLLQVFTISIPEGEQDCLDKQRAETFTGKAAEYGVSVSKLAMLTGGFNVSICEDNFGSELERISEYVESSLLITRIRIPGNPITSSIKLEVRNAAGVLLDINWKLNDGYLELFPTPPEGSKIKLSFRY